MQAALASGEVLVGLVGQSKTISDTTRKIFSLMVDANVDAIMVRLDMKASLSTVESLMRDVEKADNLNESTTTCLENLHEIVDRLHRDLKRLKEAAESDAQRWFNHFRYISYANVVADIETNANIFQQRFDMLVKVLSIRAVQ